MIKDHRIFFATDIHGSEICFKKFISAAKFYGADTLILGGDMTGKMIVAIVKLNGSYKVNFLGKELILNSDDEALKIEEKILNMGYYPFRTDPDTMKTISAEPKKTEALFHELMKRSLKRWVSYGEEKLMGTSIKCYVTPGNDDPPAVYEGWDSDQIILFDNVTGLLDEEHEILSMGVTNRTPWNTHRETDEPELEKTLENLAEKVQNKSTAIFCIHCPPHGTKIDEGPKLDKDLKIQSAMGSPIRIPVGSTAVRKFIEKHQPLLGLHGHIHESAGSVKLGKTLCINPGSEYTDGVLRGALITISGARVKNFQLTTG